MRITDVKVRKKFDDDKPLKAVLSVTFDDEFVMHEVKLVYAGGRYMTVMPGRKLPDGSFRDVAHPITREFRAALHEAVLKAYENALSEEEEERFAPQSALEDGAFPEAEAESIDNGD